MIDSAPSMQSMLAASPVFAAPPRLDADSGRSFAQALQQTMRPSDRETARVTATQLVSSAFIVPVLSSLRESPFLEPPFAPGFAEKRFAPVMDQLVADRIAAAANFSLVDAIVDRLLGPVASQNPSVGPSTKEAGHGP
ncbi:MAG: hypothetical protein ACYS0G_06525 [Planctomycetota bacterium]|jgi:hypothetical protein